VNAWDENIIGEIGTSLIPTFDPKEGFKEDAVQDLKKKSK